MARILVVDDMPIFRDPIAASLRLAGYETLVASHGVEALEQVRQCKPDLILLDVAMPVMDGLTFLRHLRREPEVSSLPVMLLTAFSDAEIPDYARRLGVRHFLYKSQFSLMDLMERVERILAAEEQAPILDQLALEEPSPFDQCPGAKLPGVTF